MWKPQQEEFEMQWCSFAEMLDMRHFSWSFGHLTLSYWGSRPTTKRWKFPLSLLPHSCQKKTFCWNTTRSRRSKVLCVCKSFLFIYVWGNARLEHKISQFRPSTHNTIEDYIFRCGICNKRGNKCTSKTTWDQAVCAPRLAET